MSKHLRAFRCGANVVSYIKNNNKYGMTCAWAMMVGYTKIAMLLGSQSVTGNNLEIGDVVGVSSLAEGQFLESKTFGSNHSDKLDKFENISYEIKDSAILINGAKVKMICKVENILDYEGDNLVFFEVVSFTSDDSVDYIDGYDERCY